MTKPWEPPTRGALDDTPWPERLIAKAVEPRPDDDRMHGYDVLGDVARHYSFSDLIYLSIRGELPEERDSSLFHIALCSFLTLSINEAPAHVSLLSKLCGGTFASGIAAGMIVIADQTRFLVNEHRDFLSWLEHRGRALPPHCTSDPPDPWVKSLITTLERLDLRPEIRLVRPELTRDAARIALLYEAGIRDCDRLEAAIVAGRWSGLAAEALAASPRDIGLYPVKLPPFHYIESEATP